MGVVFGKDSSIVCRGSTAIRGTLCRPGLSVGHRTYDMGPFWGHHTGVGLIGNLSILVLFWVGQGHY